MKTELSHNKIALYKSENLLSVFIITLFSVLYFSPYILLLVLSPITSSPPTYSSLPPSVLSR